MELNPEDLYTKKYDHTNGVGVLVTVSEYEQTPNVDVYKTYDELREAFLKKKQELRGDKDELEKIYMRWTNWDNPFIFDNFYNYPDSEDLESLDNISTESEESDDENNDDSETTESED